tara:strand:+ start:1013 stop:1447 length:435 start_codon:yes stop_codon:yes gene_type:complete
MILISHRGNINGKHEKFENFPSYIDTAIDQGYDCEIDIRVVDSKIYLGHDEPKYLVDWTWLSDRDGKLWIHCKNHEALEYMNQTHMHYFWHHDDDVTITSNGIIWSHPKIKPIKNSIAVLPDTEKWDVNGCMGVCSDNIIKYKK